MWYKNIAGRLFGLVTKHACDRRTDGQTDRRTDRQNYDSEDRASIAASRGKNAILKLIWHTQDSGGVWRHVSYLETVSNMFSMSRLWLGLDT